jgi:hypothetical protein
MEYFPNNHQHDSSHTFISKALLNTATTIDYDNLDTI